MDELYINERENIRIKQRELAQARAKAEAMRQEEIRQRQRLEAQKSLSHNIVGRNFALPYPNTRVPSNQYGQYVAGSATGTSNQGYGTGTTAGTSGGQKRLKLNWQRLEVTPIPLHQNKLCRDYHQWMILGLRNHWFICEKNYLLYIKQES